MLNMLIKMKIISLFFLIAAITLSCKDKKDAAPDETEIVPEAELRLKVLCYNLRFGELATLEEIAEFINQQNPDLVALQEVDVRTYRAGLTHQHGKDFITELGYRTGMTSAFAKAISTANGYYGVGILSKFPLASVERIFLPHPEPQGSRQQRVLLVADVEYDEDKYFTFVNTHLDHSNTEVRQIQVARINDILRTNVYPMIFAGDFNGRPASLEISEGMSQWKPLCNHQLPTSPAHSPTAKIDYIFAFPPSRWESVSASRPMAQLSDHLPVSIVVDLK